MNFKNKVAFVTGSTRGIGKAVAQKLMNLGCKVIVSSEQDIKPSKVLKNFDNSDEASYIKCDISKRVDIEKAAEYILKNYSKLDHLVCNAGIMPLPCGIVDITEDVIDKTIDVNLKGTFWTLQILGKLVQETAKSMIDDRSPADKKTTDKNKCRKKMKTDQECNQSIVNITSVDGIIGEPYGVIYSTTKAGIISLTKSFARHFSKPLVRVNAVAPGLIDTDLTASTGEDPSWTTDLSIMPRMGEPTEVADAVVYLLGGESEFITGQVLAVDGGFTLK